jgi:hypothetical protein
MADGSGRARRAALLGRVLRARINSHLQVWIVATVGFLVTAAVFWLVYGGPRHDSAHFVVLAISWLGIGTAESLVVQRRRNSARVSEAKPFGRLPRSR